jgi:hypothetical protein
MRYLNSACIQNISFRSFQCQFPYPWLDIDGALTEEGFERLYQNLPDSRLFEKPADGAEGFLRLRPRRGLSLAESWRRFIEELQGKAYETFLRRMLDVRPDKPLLLRMEWRYGGPGCLMEPRYQGRDQLATHFFLFNPPEHWQRTWGGDLLILDDQGRCNARSQPGLGTLPVSAALDPRGNVSLLLKRTDHSWHGVRSLRCPAGRFYRCFVVTLWAPTWHLWWRWLLRREVEAARQTPAPSRPQAAEPELAEK